MLLPFISLKLFSALHISLIWPPGWLPAWHSSFHSFSLSRVKKITEKAIRYFHISCSILKEQNKYYAIRIYDSTLFYVLTMILKSCLLSIYFHRRVKEKLNSLWCLLFLQPLYLCYWAWSFGRTVGWLRKWTEMANREKVIWSMYSVSSCLSHVCKDGSYFMQTSCTHNNQ